VLLSWLPDEFGSLQILCFIFSNVFSLPVHFEFFAIFTLKGFEECFRGETVHLATLKIKSKSI
jgi:hypothetical protein